MSTKSFFMLAIIFFVFGFECPGQSNSAPTPKFSEIEHNFGDIPAGQSVSCEFIIENTGNAPYVIGDVTASCGCTKPEYSPEPVMPGKKTKIKVVFNGQGMGTFSKTITVYDNSEQKYHQLFIAGNLYDPNTAKPEIE